MNIDQAKDIKLAVQRLLETEEGKLFMELMEASCGKYQPQYDPSSATSITLAAGRKEFLSTIYNLHRLNPQQIVETYLNH